jgi:hypothetical protein
MLQGAADLHLSQETGGVRWVPCIVPLREQDFDGHIELEQGIPAPVHLAHRPLPKGLPNLIATQHRDSGRSCRSQWLGHHDRFAMIGCLRRCFLQTAGWALRGIVGYRILAGRTGNHSAISPAGAYCGRTLRRSTYFCNEQQGCEKTAGIFRREATAGALRLAAPHPSSAHPGSPGVAEPVRCCIASVRLFGRWVSRTRRVRPCR